MPEKKAQVFGLELPAAGGLQAVGDDLIGADLEHAAQLPRINRLLGLDVADAVPHREGGRGLQAARCAGVQDGVAGLHRVGHRLVDNEVFPGAGGRQGVLGVAGVGRGDADDVDVLAGHEVLVGIEARDAVFCRELGRARSAGYPGQPDVPKMAGRRLRVGLPHESRADDTDTEGLGWLRHGIFSSLA